VAGVIYFALLVEVRASYYTDPACSWSWALEPALRRLNVEFGDEVRFTYVMGGLAREFGPVLPIIADWLEASGRGRRRRCGPWPRAGGRGRSGAARASCGGRRDAWYSAITCARPMRRAAVLAAVFVLALPGVALAQGSNPFGPLPEPQQPQTTTVSPTPSTSSSGSGLTSGQKTALLIGGALVIVLVGYLILRDARRRAPGRHARVRAAAAPPPPTPPRPGARGLHTGRGKGGKAGAKKRRR
jgi:hypothetical protein